MFALWERGTCRFNELVVLTSSEPPTLSRVTNQLDEEGLLTRERVVSDTRLVDLTLTEKGRLAFERLIGPALEIEKQLLDGIDPEDAPGVGTPVRGGATYREAHLAMEILADHGRLLSFELVEVNPVIDEHNRTADLAVELACSAFGKKIL